MGQMEAESSCISYRLQGDFASGFTKSKTYTSQVDNGEISAYAFAHQGPGGGGYGLCQWTFWSRKEGLYNKAKALRKSIGDEEVQIEWLWDELHQGEYKQALTALQSGTDFTELSSVLIKRYEKPADQSQGAINLRANFARTIYNTYAGKVVEVGSKNSGETSKSPTVPDEPTTPFWPPRMLTKNMVGSDVAVLQALLIARGFKPGKIDGKLSAETQKAMWEFQKKAGMSSTGDFGPKSWALLLKET